MKKLHRILLILMIVILALPLLESCKKGEEDPWFSIYSRKHRLCLDWKILTYRKDIHTNDSIVTYTFDGTNNTYRKYKSNYVYTSPGTMRIIFSKNGNYEWSQTITTDTSNYIYTEKGLWYFSGGGKESDTRSKELIALQKTEQTESFSDGGVNSTLSYMGSGDLTTSIYRLKKLASDEMIIENETTSTFVSLSSNTLMKIKTEIIFENK